jgi:glycosyltransferase involved in cell wall biosynthesis
MIKWIGPMFDSSGYTDANRNYVCALHQQLVDLRVQPMNPLASRHEMNETTELILKLTKRIIPYDVVIHHYVPERIHTLVEKGKVNIGYNTWETDRLPAHWVTRMNKSLDAVMVPSQFNKDVYEDSGIKIPIEVVPHCLDCDHYTNYEVDVKFTEKENLFKFISVFQWTERKNPIALLKAYFSEFTADDNVILILKTYGSSPSLAEQSRLKNEIAKLKNDMNLKYYPPIYFVGDIITKSELMSLYKQSDCFVLATRGEGFGIPFAEAALCRNTVIATGYGGQVDFLNIMYADLIRYQMTPVSGMAWIPNYNAHMNWAEPDVIHLKKLMRKAYIMKQEDPERFAKSQVCAEDEIKDQMNYELIGKQLLSVIRKYAKGV